MYYCKVCKQETKQIPVRKLDNLIVVEYYCPHCGESEMKYEHIQTV